MRTASRSRGLLITGQVRDAAGAGVAGVRVWVEGEDFETLTNAAGEYRLFIEMGAFGDFKSKAKIRVKAKDDRTRYHTTTRQAVLAVDIKRESRKGKEHCQIRGNEGRLVRRLGETINSGGTDLTVEGIHFVNPVRAARRLTMKAESVVIPGEKRPSSNPISPDGAATGSTSASMSPAPAAAAGMAATTAAPTRPEPTPTATRSTPQVTRVGDSGSTASAQPTATGGSVKLPGPGVSQSDVGTIRRVSGSAAATSVGIASMPVADVLPDGSGCECRIRGTVELHPDHMLNQKLNERLPVLVSLAQSPTVRDTVELFMGSPRGFELRPLRCGGWNLVVQAMSKREFTVVSLDGNRTVACDQGGLQQLRIVIAPK